MKKRCVTFVLAILMLFSLVACGNSGNAQTQQNTNPKIKIGFSFDNFVVERWKRDRDVFVSTAKELDAEVNIQNANGDVDKQIEHIQYFIDQNVDVIVIVPIEADSLKDVVRKAKDKGIKVIAYDRPIMNADVDLYISFDNELVGTLMGQEMAKNLQPGDRVLMVCGSYDDNNVHEVESGFRMQMQLADIEIVDVTYMPNWQSELVEGYLYENQELVSRVQGIMCGNDDLAREVIHYLSENRMAGDVCVVGQDADLGGCQLIVSGLQNMTVFKPVEKLAKQAAECAVILAKKGSYDCKDVFYDGKYNVPYVSLEPIAVTGENMDEVIIDSGFHLREDVYIETVVSDEE